MYYVRVINVDILGSKSGVGQYNRTRKGQRFVFFSSIHPSQRISSRLVGKMNVSVSRCLYMYVYRYIWVHFTFYSVPCTRYSVFCILDVVVDDDDNEENKI